MELVKISTINLQYPVVGLNPKHGLMFFDDIVLLTSAHPELVRDQSFIGMEIIDNSLRRWVVRSLLLEKPLPQKRWWRLSNRHVRFDLELEAMEAMGLDELKRHLIAEWEDEFPEDADIVRSAPDLGTIIAETNTQTSGFL